METWQSCGTTGNITDTNQGDETSHRHGNDVGIKGRQNRLSSTVSESEERHSGETIQEYLRRMDQQDVQACEAANGNRNHSVTFSRSTFGSHSELTSDSDYSEVILRDSHPSDAEVFLPLPTNGSSEQTKILEQRMRDLPGANQRCWKRVADYVNGLPIIPEPPHGDSAPKSSAQAKRQRIWSEGHERRRKFLESGSLSFAEGLTPHRKYTASSSSNLSQLSSLSSHEGSQQWFESADDPNQTLLPPTRSLPQNGQSPWQQGAATMRALEEEDHGTPLLKQSVQPKTLFQPSSHNGQPLETARDAVDGYAGMGDASEMDDPLLLNKDKLLQRRLTNSDLIALASQHRQRHRLSSRRQNLFHMGSSNVSEDSDTSGHSFSSIDDLLIARHDPEEILLNLGFGGIPEKDTLDRVPSRFLQQPSQAAGISVESFLNQMDELERGCGFSLVGGLRSLGPALRRSTYVNHSPSSSRGSTPTNANEGVEDRTRSSTRTASDERNNNRSHTGQVVFPETTVTNHANKQGWRVRVQEEIGESALQDVIVMTDRGQQTQDNENDMQQWQTSPTKAVLPASLPPVDEENENSLQILNTRNQQVIKPELLDNVRIQRDQADSTNANIVKGDASHEAPDKLSQMHDKAIDQKSSKELEMVGERIVPSKAVPCKQTKILRGLLLDAREDSLEFEELSSGDQEMTEEAGSTTPAPQADLHREGTLSRSESTQSDSSGFADEGISSGEISSPHQTSTVALDAKLTQTSFEGEAIELLGSVDKPGTASSDGEQTSTGRFGVLDTSQESLELPSTTSLEDSPFDDTVVLTVIPGTDSQRNRACTYPSPLEKEEESGPKNVVEILSSLQSTSRELTSQRTESITSSSGRRRPPKLRKMRSVDPECYSYKNQVEPLTLGTASRLDVLRKISDSVIYEHQDSRSAETVDHVTHHVTTVSNQKHPSSPLGVTDRGQVTATANDPGLQGSDHMPTTMESTFREPHSVSREPEVIPSQTEQETHRATFAGAMQSGIVHPVSTNTPPHLKVHRTTSSETPHVGASGPIQITLISTTSSIHNTIPELHLQSSTDISSILPTSASSPKELSEKDVRGCSLSVCNISEGLRDGCQTEVERVSESQQPDHDRAASKSQMDVTNVNSTKEETHQGSNEASSLPEDLSRLEARDEGKVGRQGCHGDVESTSIVQSTLHEPSISCDQAESIDNSESQDRVLSVCEEPIQHITVQDVTSSLSPSSSSTARHHTHEPQPALPSSIVQDDLTSTNPSPLTDDVQGDQVLLLQESSEGSAFRMGPHDSVEPIGDEREMPGRRLLRTLGGRSRIETLCEEDHVKAREELQSLLMMEVDLISPLQKSSQRSIIHQEAVEDLKLLQRALVRYHQDLEELEVWSSRLYQDVSHALSREERDELKSLSAVRHQIKDEIAQLEKFLREKYHSVVTSEEDQLSDGENLWSPSLTQVMCEMVHLLREQTTLRALLEELDSLDNPPTPPLSPNKEAEFAVDKGITKETDGHDLPLEISELEDLTFPQAMTHRELVDELVRTRSDLRKMRSQARRDVAKAVREVKQSILSDVRRDIQLESQFLQVQMQAKDAEIGNLRAMVKQLREASQSTASFDSACSQ